MICVIFCALLSYSAIEAAVIRSEESEMALPSSNETFPFNPSMDGPLPSDNDTSANPFLLWPLPSGLNETLPSPSGNASRVLYDLPSLGNSTRSPKTGWYHHFWREKLIAPNVEAGSSSSESADSWSMECDCSTTPRFTRSTSARPSNTGSTSTRATESTATSTRAAGNGSSTAAPGAFDDGSDYNRSWEDSNSLQIGDLAWRKKYRTWLRRCGCDKPFL